MNSASRSIDAGLVSEAADIASVSDGACSVWRRISVALTPVVGPQGVDALYRRSLHLTAAQHPVLASITSERETGDFSSLQEALLTQTNVAAAAAQKALLINFHTLLSSLIGESLTERLLASVWHNPTGNDPTQERAP